MSSKLTIIIANFETQLATKISVGGTTGSLKSVTDKDSVALPAGKYCMTFDGGKSKEEHLKFDLAGTAMTNIVSVSRQGVETVGAAKEHRVGASVKITDFANLLYFYGLLTGQSAFDGSNPLEYDTEPTFTDGKHIIDKTYADTKQSKDGNNVTTGNNTHNGVETFTVSPQVPSPTTSGDAVNLAYVLGIAAGSVVVGFNAMSVSYDSQGRVKSVRDNQLGKIYLITYDASDNPTKIYDGTSTWRIKYTGDRVVGITKNN